MRSTFPHDVQQVDAQQNDMITFDNNFVGGGYADMGRSPASC